MGELAFAFDHLSFSDTILHVEIESEIISSKDMIKSFIKRIPCTDFFQLALGDFESSTPSVRVRTLNVNSTILSSESHYFYKRLKDDGKELQKKELTLRIKASEEEALIDLLHFMYINNLSANIAAQLRSVRLIAEKLEATSCITYLNRLSKAPRHELYRGEPSVASMAEAVKPLKVAVKKDLFQRHWDLSNTKSQQEAMRLPLCALEIVLGNPGVRVDSEDHLYFFIKDWSKKNTPNLGTVMVHRLFPFIHFPYLNPSMIRQWVVNDPELLLRVIPLNAGTLYTQCPRIERVYVQHRVLASYRSKTSVVVYFFLTRKVLGDLSVFKQQRSEGIYISKLQANSFCLLARCGKVKGSESEHFGLYVWRFINMPDGVEFDYEFSVLTNKNEYRTMANRDKCSFSSEGETRDLIGDENLLGITWSDLMAQDNEFLVDGILRLRAEITLTN